MGKTKSDLKSKIRSTTNKLTSRYEIIPDEGPPDKNSGLSEPEIYKAALSGQDGDAYLFYRANKDRLCFDHAAGSWFKWCGHYWELDKLNDSLRSLDGVIDIYGEESQKCAWIEMQAAKKQDGDAGREAELKREVYLKKISALQKKRWKLDVLDLSASGKKSLGITGEEWDLNPWLLGCPNGVIDLKTGTLRPGKQSDYIKTPCPTKWGGIDKPCPEFESFMNGIFNEDQLLVSFVQRLLGYAITGLTTEHILPIAEGQGRNGKSVLFETLHHVIGDLAGPIPSEMLLDQGRSISSAGPRADLMSLRGKRIAWGAETDEGRKLSLGSVKNWTGGDTITGRPPYGRREITFTPTHTLFLITNHKPKIDAGDYATWQRIHLIPFSLSFIDNPQKPNERQRDPDLPEKLKAEALGILAWLVRGCLEWQKHGLNPPKVILEATSEYQKNEDLIGQFIDERCNIDNNMYATAGSLYESYKEWCTEYGYKEISSHKFSNYLVKQFIRDDSGRHRIYRGIGVKSND